MVLAQRAATVDQESQHSELLIVDHRSQPRHPGADQGDGVSVSGIGLAALAGGEDPRTSRELGWHVEDLMAFDEQPQGWNHYVREKVLYKNAASLYKLEDRI